MLSASNISKSYNARYLFSGISFNVGMRDRIAVIGQNGTGKHLRNDDPKLLDFYVALKAVEELTCYD